MIAANDSAQRSTATTTMAAVPGGNAVADQLDVMAARQPSGLTPAPWQGCGVFELRELAQRDRPINPLVNDGQVEDAHDYPLNQLGPVRRHIREHTRPLDADVQTLHKIGGNSIDAFAGRVSVGVIGFQTFGQRRFVVRSRVPSERAGRTRPESVSGRAACSRPLATRSTSSGTYLRIVAASNCATTSRTQ
jgi:hypothetical protein